MIDFFRRRVTEWIYHPPVTLIIVTGLLVLSAVLGLRVSTKLLILVCVGIFGLVAFPVLVRRPELGIVMIVPVSFLVDVEVGTGTKVPINATILLVMALIGLWILQMLVLDKKIQLRYSRVNAPALIFILVTTIALLAGNLNWILIAKGRASLLSQLGGWLLYASSVGLMLVVGNYLRDIRWIRTMTWLYIVIGGVLVLVQQFSLTSRLRNFYTSGSQGSVFWTFLAALVFGQFLLNKDLHPRIRFALGLLVLAIFRASWVLDREWISGWLPPIVAILVIVWLYSWRWGLAVSAMGGLFVVIYYSNLFSQVMTSTQQYSLDSRMATWPIMFELFKSSPILGLGLSNYVYYTPLYSLWGYHLMFNSHNNFFDILVQTGLLGFSVFAWLMAEIGLLGWQVRKRPLDHFSRGYVYSIMGGVVGMLLSGMLGDWFLPFLYNIGFNGYRASTFAWLFIGGLLAIEQIEKNKQIGY